MGIALDWQNPPSSRREEISMDEHGVLIELDGRRRASLGRVGFSRHSRYIAHTEEDGTIVLAPAVVMTEHDLRLAQRPDILDAIDDAHDHPERLVRGRRRPEGI
jgi:hypothetical protein